MLKLISQTLQRRHRIFLCRIGLVPLGLKRLVITFNDGHGITLTIMGLTNANRSDGRCDCENIKAAQLWPYHGPQKVRTQKFSVRLSTAKARSEERRVGKEWRRRCAQYANKGTTVSTGAQQ